MADRFNLDPGPDPRAVAYLESKGLQRSWRWPSIQHEQHAFAFTLAGVYRLDVLLAAKELTTKAVAEGQSFGAFRTAFKDSLNKLGFAGPQVVTDFAEGLRKVDLTAPWRLQTIYDTNVRAAYAASEWQAIQDTKVEFPALEYMGVSDERTRASHRALFGMVRPVDDPIWRVWYPPNGWRCRCWVVQVSIEELSAGDATLTPDSDLGRRGVTLDETDWETWTDKHTGLSIKVPPHVDPGFGYNAGMARREVLGQLMTRRVAGLDEDMARAAAADLVNFPQFADLVTDAVGLGQARAEARAAAMRDLLDKGVARDLAERQAQAAAHGAGAYSSESWPLARAPAELAGDGRDLVVVNASAIGHAADIHPTTPADWGRVHQLLEDGEIWRSPSGEIAAIGAFGEADARRLWMVALKPVDGAWRVRTLFPTSPRRRAKVIAGRELVRASRGRLKIEGE